MHQPRLRQAHQVSYRAIWLQQHLKMLHCLLISRLNRSKWAKSSLQFDGWPCNCNPPIILSISTIRSYIQYIDGASLGTVFLLVDALSSLSILLNHQAIDEPFCTCRPTSPDLHWSNGRHHGYRMPQEPFNWEDPGLSSSKPIQIGKLEQQWSQRKETEKCGSTSNPGLSSSKPIRKISSIYSDWAHQIDILDFAKIYCTTVWRHSFVSWCIEI